MVSINLMPWRARRQRQQWQKWRLVGALMLVVLIMAIQSGYGQQRLNHQRVALLNFWPGAQKNAAALHERTLALQKQLAEQQQAQRLQVLQRQDLTRWRDFVARLSAEIPPNIWLSALVKNQHSVSLKGFSRSVAELHQLRDRLHQQRDIPSVKLGALRRDPSAGVTFSMQLSLANQEPNHE